MTFNWQTGWKQPFLAMNDENRNQNFKNKK